MLIYREFFNLTSLNRAAYPPPDIKGNGGLQKHWMFQWFPPEFLKSSRNKSISILRTY
jgi:hypothetical protein